MGNAQGNSQTNSQLFSDSRLQPYIEAFGKLETQCREQRSTISRLSLQNQTLSRQNHDVTKINVTIGAFSDLSSLMNFSSAKFGVIRGTI